VFLPTFSGSLQPNYPDFLNLIYLSIVEVSAKSIKDNSRKKVKEGRMEIKGKNAHLKGLHDLLGRW
jgi:hypothetical protein